MHLLNLALKSRIPIIKVSTEDTINVKAILSHYAGEEVVELRETVKDKAGRTIVAGVGLEDTESTYCMAYEVSESIEELYEYLLESERTVILINYEASPSVVFDAGSLPVPQEFVVQYLQDLKITKATINKILPTIGGLNLKEVSEVIRLAMAASGTLNPQAIMSVRRLLMSRLKGITQIDTSMEYYIPPSNLTDWLEVNSSIFLTCQEPRLIPRGLLLSGPRGTGKTQGAKYVANQLQVPLYLLELGSVMSRYVGESEGNLRQALDQVDQEAPAVLLIDEVEKIFSSTDDSGVTSRLLARLLWWTQEHRSRILTIMTANDLTIIPPELYRPGRIDEVMTFEGLPWGEAIEFAGGLIESFKHLKFPPSKIKSIKSQIVTTLASRTLQAYPQADITQAVYNAIKPMLSK